VDVRFLDEGDSDVESRIIRVDEFKYTGPHVAPSIPHGNPHHPGARRIDFTDGLRCIGGKDVSFRIGIVAVEEFKGKLSFEAATREYYPPRRGRAGVVQAVGPLLP
jgi:hypothetical protein